LSRLVGSAYGARLPPQRYGLFFWTDVMGTAFDKWENSHDGYGSFSDLDAAKIADVKS
jgi:hypothetical protein